MSQPTTEGPNPMDQLQRLAEEMHRIIRLHHPAGMVAVIDTYERWPQVLQELGRAWDRMHQNAAEAYPLAPAVLALVQSVAKNQHNTVPVAVEIAPTARKLHRRELDDLQDRRKRMWDHSANPGSA